MIFVKIEMEEANQETHVHYTTNTSPELVHLNACNTRYPQFRC